MYAHTPPELAGPVGIDMSSLLLVKSFESHEVSSFIQKYVVDICTLTSQMRSLLDKRKTEQSARAACTQCTPTPTTLPYWTTDTVASLLLANKGSPHQGSSLSGLVSSPEDKFAILRAQDSLSRVVELASRQPGRGLQGPAVNIIHRLDALSQGLQEVLTNSPEAPLPPWGVIFSTICDLYHTVGRFVDPEIELRRNNASIAAKIETMMGCVRTIPTCSSVAATMSTCEDIVQQCRTGIQRLEEHISELRRLDSHLAPCVADLAQREQSVIESQLQRLRDFQELTSEVINTKELEEIVRSSRQKCELICMKLETDVSHTQVDLQRIDTKQRAALSKISDALSELRKLQSQRVVKVQHAEDLTVLLTKEREKFRQFELCAKDLSDRMAVTERHHMFYQRVYAEVEGLTRDALEHLRSHLSYVGATLQYGVLRSQQQVVTFLGDQYAALGHILALHEESCAQATSLSERSRHMNFLCSHKVDHATRDLSEVQKRRQECMLKSKDIFKVLIDHELNPTPLEQVELIRGQHVNANLIEMYRCELAAKKVTPVAEVLTVDATKETELTRQLILSANSKVRKKSVIGT